MPKKAFENLNKERVAAGEDPFMNPRNTASGSLKLQDTAEVAKRGFGLLVVLFGREHRCKSQLRSLEKRANGALKYLIFPNCAILLPK